MFTYIYRISQARPKLLSQLVYVVARLKLQPVAGALWAGVREECCDFSVSLSSPQFHLCFRCSARIQLILVSPAPLRFPLTCIVVRQVTWLVVAEVWSKSFGLVTECRQMIARHHYRCVVPHGECYYNPVLWYDYFSSSSVVSRAFSALIEVLASSSSPGLPVCQSSCLSSLCRGLHCWRKITYSPNQSFTQLVWCDESRSFHFAIYLVHFPKGQTVLLSSRLYLYWKIWWSVGH